MRMPGLLLVASLALVVSVSSGQARPSTAADDVRELGASIADFHPEPFRSVPRRRFQAEVNELAQRAPSLSRNEVLVGVLRIIALLGPRNGHTGLFPGDTHTQPLHLYPLRLYHFADGVFVVGARDRSLVRSRLVAVEGTPVERILELVAPLTPADNPTNTRGMAPHFLLTAEVLDGLGVVEGTGAATFTVERPGGQRGDVELTPMPGPQYAAAFADPQHGHNPSSLPAGPRPFYLASYAKPMWARKLASGRAVYLGYNAVVRPSDGFVRSLTRLVRNPKVRRVVVDVRQNGGGDNTTYGALTTLLASPAVDRRGKLYVLIGRATFSAAANFVAELDRDTRAIFVGEPTGGGVETYGDTFAVNLPTLGWSVHIAARYHHRKRNASDRRLAVFPDVSVELTSAQYFAGRDPVLERALRGL
jgi:Peptidase family S41